MRRPKINFREQYQKFYENILDLDCGIKCSVFNPSGKPFCCDICEAVPAAYDQEWSYLRQNTDLWKVWHGDECSLTSDEIKEIKEDTADYQILLACLGPALCQREYRAISCRQFPFFPYISRDYRFLGMAYEWHFETKCWVINYLDLIRKEYRNQFIGFYDDFFSLWPDDMESYACHSEQMRAEFIRQRRRIPVLHRNGGYYLISPRDERLRKVDSHSFQKHGFYHLDL
jgi:hypothetical protein